MKKSLLALVLTLVMLLSLAAPALVLAEEEPQDVVEIDFMYMSSTFDPIDWGADPTTAQFTEKTGVKLITSAPAGDWEQVANAMLAAGNYPSMMHLDHGTVFNKYVRAGALESIGALAEEYGYTSIIDGTYIPEESLSVRKSEDGELYMVPNWFSEDGFGSVGQTISVRNDIYADMGNPELETVDDLYAFLEQVRDANLTYNDVKVWPLNVAFTDYNMIGNVANMWGSQICRYMYYNEETGRVELMLRNDTVEQALTFLNKAYNEGILDPESLTFNGTQMSEAYVQGRYAVTIDWFWNMWTANSALSQVEPDVYYRSIPVVAGAEGVTPYLGYDHRAGTSGTVITKNCKDKEAAMRFIDYYLSEEGQILEFYGVTGYTCEIIDGTPYLMDGVYDDLMADWEGYRRTHGVRIFDIMMNQKYNWERRQESPDRQENRRIATECAFNATKLININVDAATSEGILNAEIESGLAAELTKIIIAEDAAQIPTMIGDLISRYEGSGLVALEDEWTRQWDVMTANEQA